MSVLIREAGADDLPLVRELFRELERDYAEIGVSLCFQSFEDELAGLPGPYAGPRGRILLAFVDGSAAGCVALKPLTGDACEMKRMFARAAFRGRGVGRALALAVMDLARALGYATMKLDTLPAMTAAFSLYQSLGFAPTEPYVASVPGAQFFALDLRLAGAVRDA